MKVIVAGNRDFTDYNFIENVLNKCPIITEIVSGNCSGVDKCGEQFAKNHRIPVKTFPADWNKYGKSAGPIRNNAMAEYADILIAFWDYNSKGTKNMIETMRKKGKKAIIVDI